jgi:hypothetical protein
VTTAIELGPGDVIEFTVELETAPGLADSDFLDRLADRAYELEGLSDVLIGLNPNGSIRASFVIPAATSLEAAQDGLNRFMRAFVEARPLIWSEAWQKWPAAAVPTIGAIPAGNLVNA